MRTIFIGILSLMFLFFSCEKDFDVFIPNPEATIQVKTVDRFFEEAIPAVQRFEINADSGGFVTLSSWGTLAIPPQSLRDASGNLVSGMVTLEVRETNGKGDWLRSQISPVNQDEFLEISIALEVNFLLDDQPLSFENTEPITANLPFNSFMEAPEIYYGQQTGGVFTSWLNAAPTNPIQNSEVYNIETEQWEGAYRFEISQTGWLLLGRPLGIGEPVDVCTILPEGYDEDNAAVFLVYRDLPILTRLVQDTNAQDVRFCGSQLLGNELIAFVAIQVTADGEYYFQQQNVDVPTGLHLEWMEPQLMTLEEIIEQLDTL